MDVTVTPSPLKGILYAPPSKSAAHRAVICASLATGRSRIEPISDSDDMRATIQAATAMGAQITRRNGAISAWGLYAPPRQAEINCMESGSTLRFLVPVAAALGIDATFTGNGRLMERPMTPLLEQLRLHGIRSAQKGRALTISGKLQPGVFLLPGNVSSQYITGLLFALPLLNGDSRIELSTPLESAGYVNMTLQSLLHFGISVTKLENGYHVPGGQRYRPGDIHVEGDYSNAAVWLCAGALGQDVAVAGLSCDSLQGDRAILDILRQFGAEVRVTEQAVRVLPGTLKGIDLDVSQIPDLVPIIAVVAAYANGRTRIMKAGRLRLKESDRLQTTTSFLRALGADIRERENGLEIEGKPLLTGGRSDSFNDHRIVMALAAAATGCTGKVIVSGAQAVNKSYPDFFQQYSRLGGDIHVV